eukprot:9475580-Alexandrium_andersonii.AAC.1
MAGRATLGLAVGPQPGADAVGRAPQSRYGGCDAPWTTSTVAASCPSSSSVILQRWHLGSGRWRRL